MSKFTKQTDGSYTIAFLGGYAARVHKRGSSAWTATMTKDGQVIDSKQQKTMTDAQNYVRAWARRTQVTVTHLITRQPVDISICTPHACNPATETYHSM